MADSVGNDEEVNPSLISVDNISNMKVTDLKKKLKAIGLPLTGNKNDLVSRLINFYASNKGNDSFESSLSLEVSQISELEEEVNDGSAPIDDMDLEQEHVSSAESSLEDESKIVTNSKNKINSNAKSSVLVTKPLKKRSIIQSSDDSQPPKKVVINRTTTAHTEITANPTSTPKQPITVQDQSAEDEKKPTSIKSLSAAERMALRAKRFNVSNTAVTSSTNTKAVASRNSKQSIFTPVTTDAEVLKKRAARFGQKVSTVLKQLEEKEKLLKRKCKFGASLASVSSSNVDAQEKKKERAARFGLA